MSATRIAKPASDAPAAITVVDGQELQTEGLGINLPEKLRGVAGVLARERQNYAQDVQISIRGFGARSTFGIRGLRLYLDGVPTTMPDGQGQVSNFNLASAARIEVLRGPFSALYGNASGGVIQQFTADGGSDPGTALAVVAGSDNARRQGLNVRGLRNGVDYNVDLTHFSTDGFRDHSAAERTLFNLKLALGRAQERTVTLVANSLRSPTTLDPLGLTAEQFADDPRQAGSAAALFNTRKILDHGQVGLILDQDLGQLQRLRLLGYVGQRRVLQFLAVPVAAQANPLSGGGVVDLASGFGGIDVRWTYLAGTKTRPLELVAGISADRQDQHRLGYENFAGGMLGVQGDLRRDQNDRVEDLDLYAQAGWHLDERWSLLLGLRSSTVRFRSRDSYVSDTNPDDSGARKFSARSPVLGLTFKPAAGAALYVSYGRGFETPTFDELAYRGDGSAGLNFALQAARTHSVEAGAKFGSAGHTQLELALFRADTTDELVVASNSGGRSTFQNVGQARREGFELALRVQPAPAWQGRLAYTYVDARFAEDFLSCTASPCSSPTQRVPAGAQIPGVPRSVLYADLTWTGRGGWHAALTGQAVSSMAVNNSGTARSPPYQVVEASAGYRFNGSLQGASAFVRIDNLLDRRYSGSVIVNEANGRYFEPAPGRSLLVGIDWRW